MRYPGAAWHGPVPGTYPYGMKAVDGLILHIMEGPTLEGCDAWFHNPASEVSAHFGTDIDGTIYQWVDTVDAAWAEVDGNPYWLSVENAGYSGDALTAAQIETLAQLWAWVLRNFEGIPNAPTDNPNVRGLGWHGMGGVAWGDHPECPGQPVLDQRPQIIARAAEILGGSGGFDMATLATLSSGATGQTVKSVQALLNGKAGAHLTVDGIFGPATAAAVEAWQAFFRLPVSGAVDQETWAALLEL